MARTRGVSVSKGVRRRRNGTHKLSVALVGGLAAGLINAYKLPPPMAGTPATSVHMYFNRLLLYYTGFNSYDPARRFQVDQMRWGLAPLAGGFALHWLANRLGINRSLGRFTKNLPIQI